MISESSVRQVLQKLSRQDLVCLSIYYGIHRVTFKTGQASFSSLHSERDMSRSDETNYPSIAPERDLSRSECNEL